MGTRRLSNGSFLLTTLGEPLVIYNPEKLTAYLLDTQERASIEQSIDTETASNSISKAYISPIQNARISNYRILLTENCNLACTYCFENVSKSQNRAMTRSTLFEVLQKIISRHHRSQFSIHWFGGEPLLRWRLIHEGMNLLDAAVRDGLIPGYTQNLTTNGTLINEKMARALSRNSLTTFVSIDGLRTENDRSRIDLLGRGTFNRAIKGFGLLKEAGADCGILLTPTSDNVSNLFESVRSLITEYGVKRIGINTPQPSALGWRLDGVIFANQILKIMELCFANNIPLTAPGLRIIRALHHEEPHVHDCISPNGDMAVTVTTSGDVSGCIVAWGKSSPWPDRDFTPIDLIALEQAKSQSTLQLECNDCIARTVCGGPCALELSMSRMNPDRCSFYQAFLEGFLTSKALES